MQAHLRTHRLQPPGQEMCRSHPGFNGAKGMFCRLLAGTHPFRLSIQSRLQCVNYRLVFPPVDMPVFYTSIGRNLSKE